ncbi:hypothetical protein ACFP81_09230 [Deinococcus lacus]|uniref:DUF11 domain-containing protein n=1 Tax=Deinococcus lacus TaxID=392561 RepID=A0ABW1YDI7_9DEIO
MQKHISPVLSLKRRPSLAYLLPYVFLTLFSPAYSATPNPAACVEDGRLWYNHENSLYSHILQANTNQAQGSTGGVLGDIAWGADGRLYGVAFNPFGPVPTVNGVLYTLNPLANTFSTKSISFPLPTFDFNGLGGLPNGNLVVGSAGELEPPNEASSTLYKLDPDLTTPQAVPIIVLRDPAGNLVKSAGDTVYTQGNIYSVMFSPLAAKTYLFKIPVDQNYEPVGTYTSVEILSGGNSISSSRIWGMALYRGNLYAIDGGNQANNIYRLNTSTGQLIPTGETYSLAGPYGLTARPEPWGGYCPTITLRKTTQGGTGTFNFTGTNSLTPRTLTTTTPGVPVAALPSTIAALNQPTVISESLPTGWKLSSVDCRDVAGNAVAVPVTATGFTIAAGTITDSNALTCTVLNQTVPALGIDKTVNRDYVTVTAEPERQGAEPLEPAEYDPQELTYTVVVTNNGLAPATGVVVNDLLPEGLTYLSASGPQGAFLDAAGSGGRTVQVTLPDLAVGASQTVLIRAALAPTANVNQPVYSNTASTRAAEVPAEIQSQPARTDTVYSKVFKQVQNLGRSPGPDVPQVPGTWSNLAQGQPGEVLEYCIDFVNYGTTPLRGYAVTDVLSANTRYLEGSAVVRGGSAQAPGAVLSGAAVSFDSASARLTVQGLSLGAPGNAEGEPSNGAVCFRAIIN